MKVLLCLLVLFFIGSSSAYASAPLNFASVVVTEETEFTFVPNATGYWTFNASEYGLYERPILRVENLFGHILGFGDYITVHLIEDVEYIVYAGFWGTHSGRYMLNVWWSDTYEPFIFDMEILTDIQTIPEGGGQVDIYGEAEISFTPETTGFWSFRASSSNEPFPMWLEDPFGNLLAFDNFWNAAEDHAFFTIQLVEGVEYTIRTMMPMWIPIHHSVTVELTDNFEPWLDFEHLAEEGFYLDFEEQRSALPSEGGEVYVDGGGWFSFTPETTGPWTFTTSNRVGDPLLVLTDTYGSFFLGDDDSAGDLNARLSKYLSAGVEYVLWARFWQDGTGSYTLTINPFEEIIPEPDYSIFVPDNTGTWTIWLESPFAFLLITDPSGSFEILEESQNDDYFPFITIDVLAGTEYRIWAGDWWSFDTPDVFKSPANQIRTGRAAHRAVARETDFSFIPEATGYWLIYTSNNFAGDPYLWILDATGEVIAEDDDSGDGLNAQIKIHLEAGQEYTIRSGLFQGDFGRYWLNVWHIEPPAPRPRLMPPVLN